jgi:L-lactate dehydrogenase (cytochrome)
MPVVNSIEDLRVIARSRIPRALYDYISRGSYDEVTWTRNRDDLRIAVTPARHGRCTR